MAFTTEELKHLLDCSEGNLLALRFLKLGVRPSRIYASARRKLLRELKKQKAEEQKEQHE